MSTSCDYQVIHQLHNFVANRGVSASQYMGVFSSQAPNYLTHSVRIIIFTHQYQPLAVVEIETVISKV